VYLPVGSFVCLLAIFRGCWEGCSMIAPQIKQKNRLLYAQASRRGSQPTLLGAHACSERRRLAYWPAVCPIQLSADRPVSIACAIHELTNHLCPLSEAARLSRRQDTGRLSIGERSTGCVWFLRICVTIYQAVDA
jgi:hypothetical protein